MSTVRPTEAWGRTYERIRDACQSASAPNPSIERDGAGLWMEWAWRTPEVTPEVAPEVTPEVMRMLAVIEGALGRREIQSKLGLHDEKLFREFYQQPAVSDFGITRPPNVILPQPPNRSLEGLELSTRYVRPNGGCRGNSIGRSHFYGHLINDPFDDVQTLRRR
jgi:hypothetical protein